MENTVVYFKEFYLLKIWYYISQVTAKFKVYFNKILHIEMSDIISTWSLETIRVILWWIS